MKRLFSLFQQYYNEGADMSDIETVLNDVLNEVSETNKAKNRNILTENQPSCQSFSKTAGSNNVVEKHSTENNNSNHLNIARFNHKVINGSAAQNPPKTIEVYSSREFKPFTNGMQEELKITSRKRKFITKEIQTEKLQGNLQQQQMQQVLTSSELSNTETKIPATKKDYDRNYCLEDVLLQRGEAIKNSTEFIAIKKKCLEKNFQENIIKEPFLRENVINNFRKLELFPKMINKLGEEIIIIPKHIFSPDSAKSFKDTSNYNEVGHLKLSTTNVKDHPENASTKFSNESFNSEVGSSLSAVTKNRIPKSYYSNESISTEMSFNNSVKRLKVCDSETTMEPSSKSFSSFFDGKQPSVSYSTDHFSNAGQSTRRCNHSGSDESILVQQLIRHNKLTNKKPRSCRRTRKSKTDTDIAQFKNRSLDLDFSYVIAEILKTTHPYLTLDISAYRKIEVLIRDIVFRLGNEAEHLLYISNRTRLSPRDLKFAVKFCLQQLKKDVDIMSNRKTPFLL